MDIITLLLCYLLMQKPELLENLKPLFGAIKSPEDLTKILNDVNKFKDFFAAMNAATNDKKEEKKTDAPARDNEKGQEKSQSPTAGIADEFIQQILENYLQKH